MTKERRLGRGLEALLGRAPGTLETPTGPAVTTRIDPRQRSSYDAAYPETMGDAYAAGLESESYGGGDSYVGSQPAEPWKAPLAERFADQPTSGGITTRIDVRRIDSNPYQPRQDFDDAELLSLSDSIRAHGLLQALVVRREGDRFQLIAGERRLRAAIRAGWSDVPVQIVEADDRQMAELAIIENMQRKDLNALEKAASFQNYLEQYGCTQEELASRLKLDRSTIANVIRLLELPAGVQDALRQGKITQGHARALLPLGDEREQMAFCQRIQSEGMNVRQTESAVQQAVQEAEANGFDDEARAGGRTRSASDHVALLEQEFRAALGTRVNITHNSRGRGKLVVHFTNHEEFARLRAHICGDAVG